MIAGVALGGRASLLGPALGALAVGYGQSTLSEPFPNHWIYFLGAAVHRGHPADPRRHRVGGPALGAASAAERHRREGGDVTPR